MQYPSWMAASGWLPPDAHPRSITLPGGPCLILRLLAGWSTGTAISIGLAIRWQIYPGVRVQDGTIKAESGRVRRKAENIQPSRQSIADLQGTANMVPAIPACLGRSAPVAQDTEDFLKGLPTKAGSTAEN